MTDEEMKRLEGLAKAASDAVGGHWKYIPAHGGVEGWVESETEGANIGTGYDGEWDGDAGMFSAAADPAAVLALIERVRKAEANAKEWSDRAGEWQQNAKEYARRAEKAEADVLNAERKGAEGMRAAAVDGCREWSIPMPIDVWQGTKKELSAATARALADRIQLLPLPGDAP